MKDEHKEDYESGKQDAKNADFCDDLFHGLGEVIGTVVPSSDKHEAYEAGWKDGMEEESGCFLATACIEAKGLPDNCPELNILRTFRDGYVKNIPGGEQAIREYYEIAPQIVALINRTENPKKVYLYLYEQLVLKFIELIQVGEKNEAFKKYIRIINGLKQRYLMR